MIQILVFKVLVFYFIYFCLNEGFKVGIYSPWSLAKKSIYIYIVHGKFNSTKKPYMLIFTWLVLVLCLGELIFIT